MLPTPVTDLSLLKRRVTHSLAASVVALVLFSGGLAHAQTVQTKTQACPDLSRYYAQTTAADAAEDRVAQWAALATSLADLQSRCLRSSEYYALLGAAQLNSGKLDVASESLERALLLDPTNGAAQIDYAEALYAAGQLFPRSSSMRHCSREMTYPPIYGRDSQSARPRGVVIPNSTCSSSTCSQASTTTSTARRAPTRSR